MLDPVNLLAGILRDCRLKYLRWKENNPVLMALKLIADLIKNKDLL